MNMLNAKRNPKTNSLLCEKYSLRLHYVSTTWTLIVKSKSYDTMEEAQKQFHTTDEKILKQWWLNLWENYKIYQAAIRLLDIITLYPSEKIIKTNLLT